MKITSINVASPALVSLGKATNKVKSGIFKKPISQPILLNYLGFESDTNYKGWEMDLNYILGLGDNILREKVANLILNKSNVIKTVIDPYSIISKTAKIGVGVYASKGILVNALSSIGDFVILNTGCIIEHECEIDTAAHIAPGAVLAGNVKIGKRTFTLKKTLICNELKIIWPLIVFKICIWIIIII